MASGLYDYFHIKQVVVIHLHKEDKCQSCIPMMTPWLGFVYNLRLWKNQINQYSETCL